MPTQLVHPLFQSLMEGLKNKSHKVIWSPQPADIDSIACCALLEAASPHLFSDGAPSVVCDMSPARENSLVEFFPKTLDNGPTPGIPFKKPITFVIPDYGNFKTCGINPKQFPEPDFFIGFDHHDSPATDFPENGIQIVDPEAASTTVVIYEFLRWAGVEITVPMALYTALGIYADTARLTNPKTNYQAIRIFKECLDTGISFEEIRRAATPVMTLERMEVWQAAFEEIITWFDHDLHCASLVVNKEKEKLWGIKNALTVLGQMQIIQEANVAVIFLENENGSWKVSIRSRPHIVSAARLARLLGGGGHPHMAAVGNWTKSPADALTLIKEELGKLQQK